MAPNTLIVVGSSELEQAKSVESYNPNVDEWTKVLNLNIDRTIFCSIMLEEKLMLVGGIRDGQATSTVQSYDFQTGTMENLPPMRLPRQRHVVAVLARHLYVLGGTTGTILDSVERYSPFTNTWTDVLPMPTPRSTPGVAVLNEEIYIIGGYISALEQKVAKVVAYNPIAEAWRECAPMNEMRDGPSATTIGKFIFVVGGLSPTDYLMSAEKYEPLIDRWTFIHTMSIPRATCQSIYFNDSLLVVGGFNTEIVSLVESYDVANNTWTTKANLATPRSYFSLVEVPWNFRKHTHALNGNQ